MTDEELAVDQEEALEGQADGAEEELSEEEKLLAKLKEAISVTKEEIGPLRLKMTVEVPREVLNDRQGEQFEELRRDAQVPGFRKGRAPMVLIEKRFGNEVGDQLVTQMLSSGYMAATEKEELKVLGDPLIWATVREERVDESGASKTVELLKLVPIDEAIELLKLPKEGPFRFSCEVELKPEFDLPALEKIPIQKPAVSITDDDVEEELRRMRAMRGSFKPVDDGTTQKDDLLYAEMKMIVEGEVIEQDDSFDVPVRDTVIKGVPLRGFADAATGKKRGDEITFSANIPDEHERLDIRGKTAELRFRIHEIKRLDVPPFDEEMLSSLGFESEEELRSMMRTMMESELESTLRTGMRNQATSYLLENTELELPEGVSQRTTERMLARRTMDLYRRSVPSAEIEKRVDEMRAEARDEAARQLKLLFILEKIADDRDIEVMEEEINGAIASIARRQNRRFDKVRDELAKGGGLGNLYMHLRDEKVLDSLIEDAEITDAPADDFEPKSEAKPKAKAKAKAKGKTKTKKATKSTDKAATSENQASAEKASAKATTGKKAEKKSP